MEVLIYSGGFEHLSFKCDFIDDAFIKKLEKTEISLKKRSTPQIHTLHFSRTTSILDSTTRTS